METRSTEQAESISPARGRAERGSSVIAANEDPEASDSGPSANQSTSVVDSQFRWSARRFFVETLVASEGPILPRRTHSAIKSSFHGVRTLELAAVCLVGAFDVGPRTMTFVFSEGRDLNLTEPILSILLFALHSLGLLDQATRKEAMSCPV